MTLTQAIEKKNILLQQGIKCQIKCVSGSNDSAVWAVLIEGVDY